MSGTKLSQIAAAASPPALTDEIVGVVGGTTDKLYTVAQLATVIGGRTKLTGNTVFYVTAAGSDSTGDGSSGNPWATPQFAANWVSANIDGQAFGAQINIGVGTFVGVGVQPMLGLAYLEFMGAGPTSTTLGFSTVAAPFSINGACVELQTPVGCVVYVHEITLDCTNSPGDGFGIYVTGFNQLWTSDPANPFGGGDVTWKVDSDSICVAVFAGYYSDNESGGGGLPYTIDAAASAQLFRFVQGLAFSGIQIGGGYTILGTPAIQDEFFNIQDLCDVQVYASFSGSATGTQGSVASNAVLSTFGAGTSYIPGDTNTVTVSGGGQYN